MRSSKRVAVFFLRPIYRRFFERPLWWFLAKVKAFFLAEVGIQLGNIERRFRTEDAVDEQRWASLEQRLRSLEASNAAQWDAMEQLLLALFRQPEPQTPDPDWKASTPHETPLLSATDSNRVHAASNIR
jgi:AcrR family transcriptional regulator